MDVSDSELKLIIELINNAVFKGGEIEVVTAFKEKVTLELLVREKALIDAVGFDE